MAWHLIEETDPVPGDFKGWAGTRDVPYRDTSSETIGLAVFRCGHCRAMCVVRRGDQPVGKCGKCHA